MKKTLTLSIVALLLAGCATAPTGPRVMALPGTGKSFSEFQTNDMACRQYAAHMVGNVSDDKAVRDAIVSTLIGAAAGAAIGGDSRGAGVGAGVGLIVGSASGAESSRATGSDAQYRYDEAYIQCMYASGHKVPLPATIAERFKEAPVAPAAGASTAPPPPPPPSSLKPSSAPPPDYVEPTAKR